MPVPHPPLPDDLNRTLFNEDQQRLLSTQVPILTLSASFKEDLKRLTGHPDNDSIPDVVLSRAHYSMARGVAQQAWGSQMDPMAAWLVDPLNHVAGPSWWQVLITEHLGRLLARHKLLQSVKNTIDRYGRKKIPLLETIRPVVIHLATPIDQPILSFHIVVGNILIEMGKKVCQVITDPHVREDYLLHADSPLISYCVFDERTKSDLLEKVHLMGKDISPEKVTVTGPPIDPRIVSVRNKKSYSPDRPLRLCLTTGGLGTNKSELESILEQLLPLTHQAPKKYEVIVYAGTLLDVKKMVEQVAAKTSTTIGSLDNPSAALRVIYHPQILDANELLIKHAFPWADGFITKPSGDMAYDAVAAGCFILTLTEWGVWENNVRSVFEQLNIGRRALTEHIVGQLEALTVKSSHSPSWVEQALVEAQHIDPLFLHGATKILQAYGKIS